MSTAYYRPPVAPVSRAELMRERRKRKLPAYGEPHRVGDNRPPSVPQPGPEKPRRAA